MIRLLRADERHHDRRRADKVWLSFDPPGRKASPRGFALQEGRLAPRAGVPSPAEQPCEIITYVREGTIAYEDALGRVGVIHAGEFQRVSAGRGIRYDETNASPTGWAHVFHIRLRPSEAEREPSREQRLFSTAERRGRLCVIASPQTDGRALHLHQDAVVYSALLDPGQHLVHPLAEGRSAWLHVVEGTLILNGLELTTGDGAGVSEERALSVTARQDAEILLVDLRAGSIEVMDSAVRPMASAKDSPESRSHSA